MLRVLIIESEPDRLNMLVAALQTKDCEILTSMNSACTLHEEVTALHPDIMIIAQDSPDRDTLEQICVSNQYCPRPIVMFTDDARPESIRTFCAWLMSEALPKGDLQPLVDAIADPNPRVAETAAAALADRRWEAGPEFLRLLDAGERVPRTVAAFFEAHVVEGSIPGLLRALRRAPAGSDLRKAYGMALATQTMRHDLGDDPGAWDRAFATRFPK